MILGAESLRRTENIYDTTLDIFTMSDKEGITTHEAALKIAMKRVEDRKLELTNA